MAVKRKGEWNHASDRERWVSVGLRFWLEAVPLYWTTTSFPFKHKNFFFHSWKKLHVAWLFQQYMIMTKADFSAVSKVNAGKRVFVHPHHSRAVIKQLKMWYTTSISIHSRMMPLTWVGENISQKMNLKCLHRINALWMASDDSWFSMADDPDKCSRSGTIFPNINSEIIIFVFLRMKDSSHKY